MNVAVKFWVGATELRKEGEKEFLSQRSQVHLLYLFYFVQRYCASKDSLYFTCGSSIGMSQGHNAHIAKA